MNTENKKILIIDDEPDVSFMLGSRLKKRNYDIMTSENGTEGLKIINEKLPDLIFIDLLLPDMKGFEICKKLNENVNTKNIPTVIFTASFSKADEEEAYKSGASGFITKPYNIEEVFVLVAKLLNQKNEIKEEKISREDNETWMKMKKEYLENLKNILTLIKQSLETNPIDYQAIFEQVHKIKGSSPVMGYPELGEYALNIMKYIDENKNSISDDNLKKMIDELKSKYNAAIERGK